MVNATMVAAQHDEHLQDLNQNYLKQHIAKVTRSHTANKIATYIWHMLHNNEPYRHHVKI